MRKIQAKHSQESKKKRGIVWVCLLLLLITSLCFFGCHKKTKKEESATAVSEKEKETDTKRDGELVIKLGFSTNSSSIRALASKKFQELVEEKTKGKIKIELYSDGDLGSDGDLISGVIEGKVDMTVSSAGNFANYGRVGISAFPFLFSDFEQAWEFMDSELVEELNQELTSYNIHVLANFDNGFRCVTSSKEYGPIEKVEDMIGMTIRTPDNQIVMETMSRLGAKPQVLDFTKLTEALKKGKFDGQENPITIIYNQQLYKVQKNLAITNHSYDSMPFVIREDLWNTLTEEEQGILVDASRQAQKLNRELIKKQTEEYISLLEEKGMHITYPNLEEFKEASQSVFDYFIPSYGQELINQVKERNQK